MDDTQQTISRERAAELAEESAKRAEQCAVEAQAHAADAKLNHDIARAFAERAAPVRVRIEFDAALLLDSRISDAVNTFRACQAEIELADQPAPPTN